ncbi:UNVERIFIED_CONTAM: hypothetical protein Sradi_4424600 [Sesamum radiatum]|uniref:Uncharacterized protein n=1 Tax=Sesamum radiatum TaxID=300843 RepID=A0AAW2NRN3_SESRA
MLGLFPSTGNGQGWLSKAWNLTDDEESGVTLSSGLWEANVDLFNRPVHFGPLYSSLQSMLLPVKGMEIKQLEKGRFLLHFNHPIDRK